MAPPELVVPPLAMAPPELVVPPLAMTPPELAVPPLAVTPPELVVPPVVLPPLPVRPPVPASPPPLPLQATKGELTSAVKSKAAPSRFGFECWRILRMVSPKSRAA
jgi:hypothetical protein